MKDEVGKLVTVGNSIVHARSNNTCVIQWDKAVVLEVNETNLLIKKEILPKPTMITKNFVVINDEN